MMGTFHPVVYGESRVWRFWGGALGLLVGSTLAGAAAGLGLGWLGGVVLAGGLPAPWLAGVLALVCIAYAAEAAGWVRMPKPRLERQVARKWRRLLHPALAGLVYGLGIGTGLTVYITFTGYYVVALACLLSGDAQLGAAVLGLYGFSSALPIATIGWFQRRADSMSEQVHWITRVFPLLPRVRRAVLVSGGVWLGLVGLLGGR